MTQQVLKPTVQDASEAELARVASERLVGDERSEIAGSELGWFGVGLPEALGGSGGRARDTALLIEAVGASLSCSALPVVAGIVLPVLVVSRDCPPALLRALASGSHGIAIPVESPWSVQDRLSIEAGEVSGELLMLSLGPVDSVLLPVVNEGSEQVWVLPLSEPSVQLDPVEPMDISRRYSRASFERTSIDASTHVVVNDDLFLDLMASMAATWAVDAVGSARAALERTLEYSSQREQFDRPIGSFQAYQHRCASAFIELKLGQSLAFRAASEVPFASKRLLALSAGRLATANAAFVCGEAVQLHGAMGFTWEAGLHTHLKRAKANQLMARGGPRATTAILDLYRTVAAIQ